MDDEKQNIGSSEFGSNNVLDEKQLGPVPNIEINLDYKPITLEQIQQAKGSQKKKSTYKGAVLTLFKTFVGSGILALPYSFAKGGYVLSPIVFFFLSLLINYQQIIFIEMADKFRQQNVDMDYSKFIEITLGSKLRSVSKLIVGSMQWGCCISYVIFFMEFFEYAFYGSDQSTLLHQFYYFFIALLVLLPMTLITNMALFTKISAVANGLIVFSLAIIIVSSIQAIMNDTYPEKASLANFSEISTMIGVSIYSFEAVGVLLNIQYSMQKKEKFQRLLQLTTVVVVVLFITFSLLCSIGYGTSIRQIILFNLKDNSLMSVVQVCYAVGLLLSFPVQLLPAFLVIEENAKVKQYLNSESAQTGRKRSILRMIQVVLLGLIAMFIPQFAIFLSLVGGVSGSCLQFFFPLQIYKKHFYNNKGPRERIIYCSLMMFGLLLGMFAAVNSLILLIKG